MSTLYERLQTGDNDFQSLFDVNWDAQTFTPTTGHLITSTKIYAKKIGSPAGNLIVGIRATSAGLPTGSDLTTGNVSANSLGGTNTWVEISVTPYQLTASTKYAMVFRVPSGGDFDYVDWREQNGFGADPYSGGDSCYSSNSGSTWSFLLQNERDFLFEDWGNPTAFIPKVFIM